MDTQIASALSGMERAVQLLRAGEIVAFPTETVYGLGADARHADAVAKIYEAKGRPAGNPVIVHVADIEAARQCAAVKGARGWTDRAERLAQKFWPGPLTVIVRRGEGISAAVSAGRETVAVRCPRHPVAQALLQEFGGPVAAPSANRSGFISPTTAAHVYAELAGRIPLILDGGASEIGLESTVVDVSGEEPTCILRPGAVTAAMMEAVIGPVETVAAIVDQQESAASPGLHARHYAPSVPAYRFSAWKWDKVRRWAQENGPVALLTCADDVVLPVPHETFLLPGDDAGYARVLYAALREADEKRPQAILVMMPDQQTGLWPAVSDRLRRATVELPIEET